MKPPSQVEIFFVRVMTKIVRRVITSKESEEGRGGKGPRGTSGVSVIFYFMIQVVVT